MRIEAVSNNGKTYVMTGKRSVEWLACLMSILYFVSHIKKTNINNVNYRNSISIVNQNDSSLAVAATIYSTESTKPFSRWWVWISSWRGALERGTQATVESRRVGGLPAPDPTNRCSRSDVSYSDFGSKDWSTVSPLRQLLYLTIFVWKRLNAFDARRGHWG